MHYGNFLKWSAHLGVFSSMSFKPVQLRDSPKQPCKPTHAGVSHLLALGA